MNKISLKLPFLILLVLLIQNIFCQRPKVGLVLSGGGAKGLAHVGILKAIDSAGLKIDYITGTSMGSIAGAMYAAGYSGSQIETFNKSINWPDMFTGKPKYQSVSIEEKDEYDNYAFEVPFKGYKIDITTGLIESQEIYLYFNRVFFPFYNQKEFSKFNIPFKCLATDLATGEAVLLENGEIVKAVRASMAIPGVFESVMDNNRKLVDGGIIRNFPVSDCKDMGAKYIIGVNLFPGLSKLDDLNNAIDVMYQITQYRDAEDLVKQKALCNLLINPPLGKYNAGSFGSAKEIEDIGNEIGKQYYPLFKHLADSLNALEPIAYDPYHRYKGCDSIVIDEILSEGRLKTTDRMLREQLGIKNGSVYNSDDLDKAFRNAYASLYYKSLIYELLPTMPNHAILKIKVRENELSMLKLGLNYHSFTKAALVVNFTRRNLFFDKSRSMLKISVGDNIRIWGQHKQFFGNNLNDNIGANAYYDFLDYPLFRSDRIAFLYSTHKIVFNLNYTHEFGLRNSISIGTSYEHLNLIPQIADIVRYNGTNQNLYSYFNYSFNNLDRRYFPRRGTQGYLEAGVYFDNKATINMINDTLKAGVPLIVPTNTYLKLKFTLNHYYYINSRVTFIQNIQGAVTFQDDTFYFQNSFLGGVQTVIPNQMPFVGYQESQINTGSYVTNMVGLQLRTIGELYAIFRANIGLTDIYRNRTWFNKERLTFRSGISVAAAYNLSVFPVELNLMYSPEFNGVTTHVSMGFLF